MRMVIRLRSPSVQDTDKDWFSAEMFLMRSIPEWFINTQRYPQRASSALVTFSESQASHLQKADGMPVIFYSSGKDDFSSKTYLRINRLAFVWLI